MAGGVSEEAVETRSVESVASGHRNQSGGALAELKPSELAANESPSTSIPYWDTDDDDNDDAGPKPSELYGKFTWKVEKFSQLDKRERRSSTFEVGGYKWYVLMYPQGCDVSNHLSVSLCRGS